MTFTAFFGVHEASGDSSTANLVEHLRAYAGGDLRAVGLGGPDMAAAGVELWEETTTHALMGLVEIVGEIPRVLRNIRDTARRVAQLNPDVVVLVDAPDYNIRLAKAVRKVRPGIPIVYFLCPQIWAWRIGRVSQLRKYFDHRFCILPFEPAWYRKFYTPAEFIGHPAVGRIKAYREKLEADAKAAGQVDGKRYLRARYGIGADEPVLAILPGSRGKEIRMVLDRELQAAQRLNERRRAEGLDPMRVVVSVAPRRKPEEIRAYLDGRGITDAIMLHVNSPDEATRGNSYDACAVADQALVCSGTATVETALIGTPQVVVYRATRISWFLLMRLVQVRFASIVNLIMDREVIPERLQHFCTPQNLADTLWDLSRPDRLEKLRDDYHEVQRRLGPDNGPQRAAWRIATDIFGLDIAPLPDPITDVLRVVRFPTPRRAARTG